MRAIISLVILFCFMHARADKRISDNISISGATSLTVGQAVHAKFRGVDFSHQWQNDIKANLGVKALMRDRMLVDVGIEARLWHQTFPWEMRKAVFNPELEVAEKYFSIYIDKAYGMYKLLESERAQLHTGAGLFKYKYNENVRNLGEYLFRTGAYPPYIIGNFDAAFARIAGIRVCGDLLDSTLHQEFFLTTELDYWPFHDISLTYLVDYTAFNIVTIGGGIQFHHLISVDENRTHPEKNEYGQSNDKNAYIADDGDTAYYTFRGTKLMGRLSADPKPLFSERIRNDFFGENDLVLYAEIAALGVQSYPGDSVMGHSYSIDYENLNERLPVMIGLNVPGHPLVANLTAGAAMICAKHIPAINNLGIPHPENDVLCYGLFPLTGAALWAAKRFLNINTSLDLFSFELEFFAWKYPNSLDRVVKNNVPQPGWPQDDYIDYDYSDDDYKWSVYLKKNIGRHFSVIAQAARDHIRHETPYEQQKDREEMLTRPNHWHWRIKSILSF
jgi:hypothetical protein